MKINGLNEENKEKVLQLLNGENKSEAIIQAFEFLNETRNKDLIEQLQTENEEFEIGQQNVKALGLRNLSKNEKSFYEKLAKQSVTFEQDDIIPTTVIDQTLAEVKKASKTLNLVKMAPAGVKKWITSSKTGTASWGALGDKLTSELTAKIESLNLDVNKLYVLLVVPKSIRELALPFVDKYFRAILVEAMQDGLVFGYLTGTGVNQPIGIFKHTVTSNEDGTKKDKTVNASVTDFLPKNLAPVKKYLSKDGKRAVNKLYVIANPNDVYEYIEPSLYLLTAGGYISTAKTAIEVIEEPNCPEGKAAFTIDQEYVMGMSAIKTDEYKEAKALDDCNVFIAKTNANGRPTDDNTAYIFDPTKLVEAVLKIKEVTPVATASPTAKTVE